MEYFIDFVIGEIDEIEHVISWADAHHHPETALNKIRQIVVFRQSVEIYARDVLMEQSKLPDHWEITTAVVRRSSTSKKKKKKSKGATSRPG